MRPEAEHQAEILQLNQETKPYFLWSSTSLPQNEQEFMDLSWIFLLEIVQTGPIEPFILEIINRINSAL